MTKGSEPRRSPTLPTSWARAPEWVRDVVFYQIFPDRFARSGCVREPGPLESWDSPPTRTGFKGGDLAGIERRLEYLVSLGVGAIYLNPIFASASNHRYHPYDYFRVDPILGGDAALRSLIDAAHARGIRIVLDGVFNHASRGFWPFHHVLENGASSPYAKWFHIRGWPLHAYESEKAPNYEAWWGMHALPKLDVSHPELRRYLLEAVEHWTRFGIDGWRLDVPEEIRDRSFWTDFRRVVRGVNPDAYLVGEVWGESSEWLGADRFDGLMNYPFLSRALGFLARKLPEGERIGSELVHRRSATEMRRDLERQTTYYPFDVACAQLNILSSHDTPRFLTRAGGDHTALYLAALLQMTIPGVPCIYYGDEIGLEGGPDPDCRRSFPSREESWHRPTLDTFRRAVALRRDFAALRRGRFISLASSHGCLAFLRELEDEFVLVAINASDKSRRHKVELPGSPQQAGAWRERWSADAEDQEIRTAASLTLELPPRSARVLEFVPEFRESR
jgi:cyclomaltodextrinase